MILTAKLSKTRLTPVQQPNQLYQMTIRYKQRDFLAFYSTSRNYFPVLLGQGPFESYHLVPTWCFVVSSRQ